MKLSQDKLAPMEGSSPAPVSETPGVKDGADPEPAPREELPTGRAGPGPTTLVLGGSGAKVFAHAGAFAALESLGFPLSRVVASGAGAIFAAAWAGGASAADLTGLADGLSATGVFGAASMPAPTASATLRSFLMDALPTREFGALPRGFTCSALSLSSGAVRHFGLAGQSAVSLIDAVLASASVPGRFEPVDIEGHLFVDGSFAEPLALASAEAGRPELIVAVDTSRADHHAARPVGQDAVLARLQEIVAGVLVGHELHRRPRKGRLVLIKPRLADVPIFADVDVAEVAARGEREASRALATHPRTRYRCDPDRVKQVDRWIETPRDHVYVDVNGAACIHCGLCAAVCVTDGFASVPFGSVVRKLHHYECTRDSACERSCPTGAIQLRNL
ncbi:MAG: patatin-like phospholipase family protein [Planctomycetota bacterium]